MKNMVNSITENTITTSVATTKTEDPLFMERRGLSIAIISRGTTPTIWMKHMMEQVTKRIPSGVYWNLVWAFGSPESNGKNYAALRNECVVEAMRRGSKWIFFIDDDVFVPSETIPKMMSLASKGYQIISGVYYKKSEAIEPVVFKHLGDGPYYNFPINEVFEIEGNGAGCVWIDIDVFKKFEAAGIPYFKQDWFMALDKKGKNLVQVEIGEDHWLYYQAKQLGIPSYCDSSILCDHYDAKNNKMFPIETEVARIRGLDFRKQDVWKERIKRFEEAKKPNIVFIAPTSMPFDGNSIKNKPIGGSETAMIHTAKGLAQDYNVVVFCPCPRPETYDGVLYVDVSMMDLIYNTPIDTLVMYRANNADYVKGIKEKFKPKKMFFWTQDYPMYPGFNADFPKLSEIVDKVICVSNDHKNALLTRFPCQIDDDKIVVIENGVNNELYKVKDKVTKKKNQFYYSSTPFRGLDVLLEVFPRIKEKVPDATLKVCSSMNVYGDAGADKQYEHLYKKCKELDGVEYLGSKKQEELAKLAMESYMMLYPCTFAETACIAVMEAQTAGTPVVCNDLGALKETVHGGCGIRIVGNPKKKEWQDKFVETVVEVCKGNLSQPEWEKMHEECLKQNFDWSKSVKKWKEMLFQLVGEPSTKVEKP